MISLIIPTLNEEKSIPVLLEKLTKAFSLCPNIEFEVIFIDDTSTDKTIAVIQEQQKQHSFIKYVCRQERGLATAVLRGFQEAKGDILAVMDADLSHPADLIPEMVKNIFNYDLIIASRHAQGGAIEEWPWSRKLGSLFCTKLTILLGIKIKDPMSGFFMLKKSVINEVKLEPLGYKILLEILVKGKFKNYLELPYSFKNRELGTSKMDGKIVKQFFQHFWRLFVWRFKNWF
ncbi:MAG: polyprenol monophosphomannose synthase [Planctomycetes bacterium]|jgi:dolichol-phosphate mannosyltransferase|nr:polyprenol monophosphomannose synthase [Planctomycetota bacterium]